MKSKEPPSEKTFSQKFLREELRVNLSEVYNSWSKYIKPYFLLYTLRELFRKYKKPIYILNFYRIWESV